MAEVQKEDKTFGFFTRKMADHCHNCPVCSKAAKKPDSFFGKLMSWHQSWCPARAAHDKVYGKESLPG